MYENKQIRPKFHFLTKIEIKMTYLVFFFVSYSAASSPLKPFGSCFIDVYNFGVVPNSKRIVSTTQNSNS